MILGFDIDGTINLRYDVDGGKGYDDAAEEAITFRGYDLNIYPLLKDIVLEKIKILSHVYNVPEDMFEDVAILVNRHVDGDVFQINGLITFDVVGELPSVSNDILISKLIEYIENKFTADIESIIDVEPLKEMVNHDRSIDFRIERVHGIGANVIETR